MKDTKIQWHPGFVAAMNLEFKENKKDLIFEKEHNLNTKPLEVDLLIVKKDAAIRVSNEIGAFFRGHNLIEYKSPRDHLDIDVFYKSMANISENMAMCSEIHGRVYTISKGIYRFRHRSSSQKNWKKKTMHGCGRCRRTYRGRILKIYLAASGI